jgi:uncharacterized protein
MSRMSPPLPRPEPVEEDEAERRAREAAAAAARADPCEVPHADTRARLRRLAAGEADASPPETAAPEPKGEADAGPLTPAARAALPELCRRFGVRRLALFGSTATGRFDPGRSDLDFLVAFEERPPAAAADAYFGLHTALEALFGRPVDLVTERPALENPWFRRRVEAEARVLFPAG